jgi:hypothetical protein
MSKSCISIAIAEKICACRVGRCDPQSRISCGCDMLHRKFVYTALAVVLIAGLAGAFALYRLLETGHIPDPERSDAGREAISIPAGDSQAVPDRPYTKDIEAGRETGYSLARNLLKNPSNRPAFGSFRLKSIIADDAHPESGRATIEEIDTGSARTYALGDPLPDGSSLVEIKQDYVVLEKNGVRKRIFFSYGRGGWNSSGSRGFAQVGDDEFNLSPYRVFRGDADRVLDFSLKIHSREGEMDGIQVSGIKPGTLAERLGLKDGDVLLEANGQKVDSLLNAVKASMNAHGSDDLQLKVRRDGKVMSLTYHLFWEGQGSWTPADVMGSKAVSSLLDESILSNLF